MHADSVHWQEVRQVIGELNRLHDVLSSPDWHSKLKVQYEELGFSDWTGVETLVKLPAGKPWILAVNTQFDPMQAVISGLPEGLDGTLEVVGEGRKVSVNGGSFADRFQPYEVHIYRNVA
jgi:hypothetical protein